MPTATHGPVELFPQPFGDPGDLALVLGPT
jgi:hypothetical protein